MIKIQKTSNFSYLTWKRSRSTVPECTGTNKALYINLGQAEELQCELSRQSSSDLLDHDRLHTLPTCWPRAPRSNIFKKTPTIFIHVKKEYTLRNARTNIQSFYKVPLTTSMLQLFFELKLVLKLVFIYQDKNLKVNSFIH